MRERCGPEHFHDTRLYPLIRYTIHSNRAVSSRIMLFARCVAMHWGE